ncbi:MAG: ParB/RepB/Spo0J family partition protein [Pirellulales bacterium]
MVKHKAPSVPAGTFAFFAYNELHPNPLNPRRLFDREPLQVLEESIRRNGILVPLTVYREKNGEFYIIDGERRWRCAEAIATDPKHPLKVKIPSNIVEPPTPVANVLSMFNIHNLRAQWELMPTALSLKILMEELHETDEAKLAELTHLSQAHVRRCKILLTYPKKYQRLMLDPNRDTRVAANFFIELHPVLEMYAGLPAKRRGGKTRDELIDHFLVLYRANKIKSVIHFRQVMEAHDLLEGDTSKFEEFLGAVQTLAESEKYSIRQLFDKLTAEDKSAANATELCKDFLRRLENLKIANTASSKRTQLIKNLTAVRGYIDDLLGKLEG